MSWMLSGRGKTQRYGGPRMGMEGGTQAGVSFLSRQKQGGNAESPSKDRTENILVLKRRSQNHRISGLTGFFKGHLIQN